MSLIKKMLESISDSKKITNKNLYYGYIATINKTNEDVKSCDIQKRRGVICKPLTKEQRNRYLRAKYQTFLDGENCEMDKYVSLINSDIEYYLIPSKNRVVPYVAGMEVKYLDLIDVQDEVLLDVGTCLSDTHMFSTRISIKDIRQIEKELNEFNGIKM